MPFLFFAYPFSVPFVFIGHFQNGFKDMWVGSATAEVSAGSFFYLFEGGVWIGLQQVCTAHQHARRTESTLGSIVVDKSLLEGMQLSVYG